MRGKEENMTNLNTSLETLFGKMENFINSKTVVGEPIHIGDTIILPLIDVTFGVGAAGRDENPTSKRDGGGLGAKITPSAVLIVNQKNDSVQMVNIKNQDAIGKLIDMAPGVLAKIQDVFKGKTKEDEENQTEEEQIEEAKQAAENEIMRTILDNTKSQEDI